MKIIHQDRKTVSFKDLNEGDIYYNATDVLCMKITAISNFNAIVIEDAYIYWENLDTLVTPVNAELIVK